MVVRVHGVGGLLSPTGEETCQRQVTTSPGLLFFVGKGGVSYNGSTRPWGGCSRSSILRTPILKPLNALSGFKNENNKL